MNIKRSASSTPDGGYDTPPASPSPTTPKTLQKFSPRKKINLPPGTEIDSKDDIKPNLTPKKAGAANGPWTGEKKEKLVELVFTKGLANFKADELAAEVGLRCQLCS